RRAADGIRGRDVTGVQTCALPICWFANTRDFAVWLNEDIKVRDLIEKRFNSRPTIDSIEIERSANHVTITIHTAKAGVVIGRGRAEERRGGRGRTRRGTRWSGS